jgi:protocatechuate 3,4-dioxygenase beta subunit
MCAKRIAFLCLAALIGLASPGMAVAGTTGVVSGQVFDESGRPLEGATVELITLRAPFEPNHEVDSKSHELQVRTTSVTGFFVFISIDPGFYQIRSVAPGMYFTCPPRVVVGADQTSYVNLVMFFENQEQHCDMLQMLGPS